MSDKPDTDTTSDGTDSTGPGTVAGGEVDATRAEDDRVGDTAPDDAGPEDAGPDDAAKPPDYASEQEYDATDPAEDHSSPVAAKLLTWLLLLIVGGGAALWGAPKLAPHLPQGLEGAQKFLTPGRSEAEAELVRLRGQLDAAVRESNDRMASRFETLRSEITGEVDGLSGRLDDRFAALSADVEKMIADAPEPLSLDEVRSAVRPDMEAIAGDTAAASVAQLGTRVTSGLDTLRSTLTDRLASLDARIEALEAGDLAPRLSAVQSDLNGLSGALAAVSSALDGLSRDTATFNSSSASALAALHKSVAAAVDDLASLSGETDALAGRVAEAEAAANRKIEEAQASAAEAQAAAAAKIAEAQGAAQAAIANAIAAAEERVAALTARAEETVETIRDEAETRAEQVIAAAETARSAAELRAAFEVVEAAIGSGASYSNALATLASDADLADATEVLGATAEGGVATLEALQARFPSAAIAALRADAASGGGDSFGGRLGSFFESRVRTRSLTPRDGDDADAVLSRAEAALRDGDLAAVLAELDTLPEAAKAALAGWLTDARARVASTAALEDVRQSLAATN